MGINVYLNTTSHINTKLHVLNSEVIFLCDKNVLFLPLTCFRQTHFQLMFFSRYSVTHEKAKKKKAYSLCYVVTCAASIRLIYFVRRLSKASFIHVANICVPTLSTTLGLMLERQRQWSPLSSDLQCNDGQRRTVGKRQDLHTTLASERSRAVLLDDWLSSQIEFAERGLRTGQQSKGRKLCSPLSAFL